jgi:hypothetical protein
MRRYFPPLQPEDVHAFRRPRSVTRNELVDAWLYPINDMLKRHSHFYILVKRQLRAVRMRVGLTAESLPRELLLRDSAAGRWDTTTAMFREMAVVAQSHGVPIRFFLIPSSYQVNPAELRTFLNGFGIDSSEVDVNQPNSLLATRLAASGIKFADAIEALRAADRAGLKLYGSVDAHLSPDGHKVLTAVVLPQLLDMLTAQTPR